VAANVHLRIFTDAGDGIFERITRRHQRGASEDSIPKRLNDSSINSGRQPKVIRIHDQRFHQGQGIMEQK
jgi:hypothetical protein